MPKWSFLRPFPERTSSPCILNGWYQPRGWELVGGAKKPLAIGFVSCQRARVYKKICNILVIWKLNGGCFRKKMSKKALCYKGGGGAKKEKTPKKSFTNLIISLPIYFACAWTSLNAVIQCVAGEWTHLRLASFLQHIYCELHLCCCMYQLFIPSFTAELFHCIDIIQFCLSLHLLTNIWVASSFWPS